MWEYTLDFNETNGIGSFYPNMVVSSDSSTYVVTTSAINPLNGRPAIRIDKVNYFGQLLWSRSYPDPSIIRCGIRSRISVPLIDGGLAVFGVCSKNFSPQEERLFRLLVDVDGEIVSTNRYPSLNTIDGHGRVVAASFGPNEQILAYDSPLDTDEEMYVIRMNMAGDVLDHHFINNRKIDQVVKLDDNKIVYLEFQESTEFNDTSPRGTHVGVFDFTTDSIVWDSFVNMEFLYVPEQEFPFSTIWSDPIDMIINQQGNILLLTQANLFGALLKCYSPTGEALWHRWIYFRDQYYYQSTTERWYFRGMTQKEDGSLAMVGVMTGDYNPVLDDDGTTNQAFVLQLDSLGCFEPGCESNADALSIFTDVEDNWQIEPASETILTFPNPASDRLQFLYLRDESGQLPTGSLVTIFDLLGRVQLSQRVVEAGGLDITQLAAGSYTVRFQIPGVGVVMEVFIKK
jgi:hypothetical protein